MHFAFEILEEVVRGGDASCHCTGCDGCRRSQMGNASWSLPSHEVAVGGAEASHPGWDFVVVHAQAHRATRHTELCAGLFEDSVKSFF